MSSPAISQLLKLPPEERAELAVLLWESLSEEQREHQFELTPSQEAELDGRWTELFCDVFRSAVFPIC